MPKAIVLLSGGLDSATALWIARSRGFECVAISFNYGQRHRAELDMALQLAQKAGCIEHLIIPLPELTFHKGSALTYGSEVPKDRMPLEMAQSIPTTYVPGRNILFLAFASSLAEQIGADAIFIGVNALDYSGYPDCRPEFVQAFSQVLKAGTKRGVEHNAVKIEAPLMHWTKSEIITNGMKLGVPYEITHSCYDPVATDDGWKACGRCDSCVLRRKGFEEAGVKDPTKYCGGCEDKKKVAQIQ